MKLQYLLLLTGVLIFSGCEARPRHHTPHKNRIQLAEKEEVKVYRIHRQTVQAVARAVGEVVQAISEDSDSYLYVIYDSGTRNYYSASSATRVSSYTGLSWSRATTAPKEVTEKEAEELETEEVETTELGEAESEISADVAAENASVDASNAATDAADAAADSADASSSSDSSSDSSSSGDSGGGDGGD